MLDAVEAGIKWGLIGLIVVCAAGGCCVGGCCVGGALMALARYAGWIG